MDHMSITRCQGTLWIENSCPLWNATLLLCRRKVCSIMLCILPTSSPLINLSSFLPFFFSLVSRISLSSDSYFCLVSCSAWVQRRRPAYSDIFCRSFTQSCASNKFFSRTAHLWVITQQVVVKNCHYSLNNYHPSLRNSTEERNFHLLRGGSPKSPMYLSTCAFVFYIFIVYYIEWANLYKLFIQVILTP